MKRLTAALFILSFIGISIFAADCDIDVSGCSRVVERFFFEDKENKINSATFYYDQDDKLIMKTFPDSTGEDRYRAVYKYDDNGELLEYSRWSRSTSRSNWQRNSVNIIEKSITAEKIIYTTRSSQYNRNVGVTRIVVKDHSGMLLSEEYPGREGSYSYKEYNSHGDVVFFKYENEKSDGLKAERYDIEYDDEGNKIRVRSFMDDVLYIDETHKYDADNLLVESVLINHSSGEEYVHANEYNDNNQLILTAYLDASGTENFAYYYEYDEEGRLSKKGERSPSYERYWKYEYHEVMNYE